MYKKLYFGNNINNHWNILELLDENKNQTEYISIRGEFWNNESENDFIKLINNGKKVIGLSSYQNFPKFIINPIENRGPINENDTFINKYGHLVIVWLHCFKDSINYIPPSIPKLLYSETDQYPNIEYLNSIITKDKKYDFIASIQESDWNLWIRGLEIAKKWLNYMADEMGLKILVCGSGRLNDFSKKIDIIEFKPWIDFINILNMGKYLFCSSRYDASPRIIIEAMSLNMPVLLNENILGGWKYINDETGMFFFYDEDIKTRIDKFIKKVNNINPYIWVKKNINRDKSAEKLGITLSYLQSFKISDFIDKIIVINLNKITNYDIIKELNKMEFNNDIIHIIDGIKSDNNINNNLILLLSHIKAINIIKENKWNNVLILENNFVFDLVKERFLFLLKTLYNYMDKWDIFMLNAHNHLIENTYINIFKKVIKSDLCNGYIINYKYIDTLNDAYIKDYNINNNNNWIELQQKNNFIISDPMIGK